MRQRRLSLYKRTAPPPVTEGWTTKRPGSSEEELWHWTQLRGGPVDTHQLMDYDWHRSKSEQMEAHRKNCEGLRATEYKLPRYVQRELNIEQADVDIANEFHEAFEIIAPRMGVHSRVEQARAWADTPLKNQRAMTAAIQHLLRHGLIVPGPAFGEDDAPEVPDEAFGAPRVIVHTISPPREIAPYGEVIHHGLDTYDIIVDYNSFDVVDRNSIKVFSNGEPVSKIRIVG